MDRRSEIAHSSSYGQACMACYKAKCRCVPSSNGDACERCARLRKDCQPSGGGARRRNAHRFGPPEESDGRVAQLEGKIESLLSAMQSIASSSGSPENINRILNGEHISQPASTSATTTRSNGNISNATGPGSRMVETFTPPTATPTDESPASQSINSLSDPPSWQADEALDLFRKRMLPCFPFLAFGPGLDTTAAQLRQHRPVLFQAILTVTTFSTQDRLVRADKFKSLLFTSAMVNVQSNMDLLLGTLTYLAWSTDLFLGGADLVSRLMMLAVSLVYDLRLFKPSALDVQLTMSMTQGAPYQTGQNHGEETMHSFLEKQRALLACFILTSNVSSHLGRQDALRWTPQMQEALNVIESGKMSSTDEAFALHVRLHILKQKALYIREQRETDTSRTGATAATTSLPGLLYLKSLRGQLHDLVSSFPARLHQKGIFNTYAQCIELYINQLAYSMSWGTPLLNLSSQKLGDGTVTGFERLECLWRSVENVKAWVDNFCAIAPSDLIGLPSHFWSQMVLCITILKYLSTLSDPDWDIQAVRNTVNLITAIDAMLHRLEMGNRDPVLQGNENLFKLLSKLLTRCRGWAEGWMGTGSEMQGLEAGPGGNANMMTGGMQTLHVPELDQLHMLQTMDLGDDQWIDELLGGPPRFFQ